MSYVGASMEEMKDLEAALSREAGTVHGLASQVASQLEATWWVGPAADRFRAQWANEFQPMLTQLHESLASSSLDVARHARAIQQAGG